MEQIENEINSDPTLRFILRESRLDSKHLMHQIDVRIAAFNIALAKYLNRAFPTK